MAKYPTKRAAKHNNNNITITTTTLLQQKQYLQEQQQHTQTVQQQKHKSTHDLTTVQRGSRATTTINDRNNIRFGAVIPAK